MALNAIRKNIQGRWELKEVSGGFCGNCGVVQSGTYWEFKPNDMITVVRPGRFDINTNIVWTIKKGYPASEEGSYVMTFQDDPYISVGYVYDGITNDTLKVHTFGTDPEYYSFVK